MKHTLQLKSYKSHLGDLQPLVDVIKSTAPSKPRKSQKTRKPLPDWDELEEKTEGQAIVFPPGVAVV